MNNNIFGNLNSEGLEAAKDVLGGGFGAIDSAVYDGKIKAAYAGKSDGGAHSMTFVVGITVNGQAREYKETIYVTNKQGQNYYEKDGKKNPLPGYVTANDICLLSTGHELNAQDFEERVIKIWSYEAKAEVPTKVQMAVDLIGKDITLAILKSVVDKTAKNDATGAYEPTGETREENNIDKAFHTESGRTVSEVVGKRDGEFKGQWADKNTGQVRMKAKGGQGKAGAPGGAAAPGASSNAAGAGKGKSLFG